MYFTIFCYGRLGCPLGNYQCVSSMEISDFLTFPLLWIFLRLETVISAMLFIVLTCILASMLVSPLIGRTTPFLIAIPVACL